jgi:hypothetical protein
MDSDTRLLLRIFQGCGSGLALFKNLNPDPHLSENLDPDPHYGEKLDSDRIKKFNGIKGSK